MRSFSDKRQANPARSVVAARHEQQPSASGLMGGHSKTVAQTPSQEMTNGAPRVGQLRAVQDAAKNRAGRTAQAVIQRAKNEHAEGDLHYGIHAARVFGLEDMPLEAGTVSRDVTAGNPGTVDELNGMSGITKRFQTSGGDLMKGYFAVMNMLRAHRNVGPGGTKPGRWLDFLKQNIDYLSIAKHVAQIQSAGATTAAATKDRLNKNGQAPGAGLTNAGKRDAIVAAYRAQKYVRQAGGNYKESVNDWVWDVFFRRTSKLGIKFTVSEGRVIHMNMHAPARRGGAPASRLEASADNPVRGRQPITHSELRYINRVYGHNHANIDAYAYDRTGAFDRTGSPGDLANYNQAARLAAGKVFPKP